MNWKNTICVLGSICMLASVGWAKTDCQTAFPGQKVQEIHDEINLPFEDDTALPGYWKAVDFVKNPGVFNPQKPVVSQEQLFVKELIVLPQGEVLGTGWNWTKGHFLHSGDQTDSAYEIRDIADKKYLFLQWKSGDYTFRGEEPAYYVLEKAK